MSLLALNELLESCDAKKQLIEIARYTEAVGPHEEEEAIWGSVTKHIVTKVLCGVDSTRTEKDLRTHYTKPLRAFLSTIHSDTAAHALRPPLTPTSLDLLLQHLLHVLRLPTTRCAIADYSAIISLICRVEKYGFWMQPHRVQEFVSALQAVVETEDRKVRIDNLSASAQVMCKKPPTADAGILSAIHSLLAVYPRPLAGSLLHATFSFCTGLIKSHFADPAAQNILLPAMDTVALLVRRFHLDHLALCQDAIESMGVEMLKVLNTQRSSEAVRQSVVGMYQSAFLVYDFLNFRGRLSEKFDKTAYAGISGGDELWGTCSQILQNLGKLDDDRVRQAAVSDARHSDLLAVMGNVAFDAIFKKALSEETIDDDADEEEPGSPSVSPSKKRRLQQTLHNPRKRTKMDIRADKWGSLIEYTCTATSVSLRWLRVLQECLAKQVRVLDTEFAKDSEVLLCLSQRQIAHGMSSLIGVLSDTGNALESVQALLLDALQGLLTIAQHYKTPTPRLHSATQEVQQHLLARLKSAPTATSVPHIFKCLHLCAAEVALQDVFDYSVMTCCDAGSILIARFFAEGGVCAKGGGGGATIRPASRAAIKWIVSSRLVVSAESFTDAKTLAKNRSVLTTAALKGVLSAPLQGERVDSLLLEFMETQIIEGFAVMQASAAEGDTELQVLAVGHLLETIILLMKEGVWGDSDGKAGGRILETAVAAADFLTARCWRPDAVKVSPRVLHALLKIFSSGHASFERRAFDAFDVHSTATTEDPGVATLLLAKSSKSTLAGHPAFVASIGNLNRKVLAQVSKSFVSVSVKQSQKLPQLDLMDISGCFQKNNTGEKVLKSTFHAEHTTDAELLCRVASGVIRVFESLQRRHTLTEPSLAGEVDAAVQAIWTTQFRSSAAAFYLLPLLAAAGTDACMLSCLTKAREVLSEKRYKHDEYCNSSVLRILTMAVGNSETLSSEDVCTILSDTIEKLVDSVGTSSSSAAVGNKIFMSPSVKADFCHATMSIIKKAEAALLSLCLEAFLPFLSDLSYGVRFVAAGYASALVNLFDQPHGVFVSISEKLAPHFADKEEQLTQHSPNTKAQSSVFAIADIAKKSDVLQSTALLQLLLVSSQKTFSESAFLERKLLTIAASAGLNSVVELIEVHLPFILRGWVIVKNLALRAFPFRFLGCAHYQEFLTKYIHAVLPTVLQCPKRAQLVKGISETLGEDETELLVQNIAAVFGQAYLNYYTRDTVGVAKAICEEYVKGKLSEQRLALVLEANVFNILKVFLRLESCRPEVELPYVSSATADRAFHDFAALWGHRENPTSSLLSHTPDCAYGLILYVGTEVLMLTRPPSYREDRFRVFLKLLKRCAHRTLAQAHVFRLAAHILLFTAETFKDEREGRVTSLGALKELTKLCGYAAKHSPLVLSRCLSDVVTRLVALTGLDVAQVEHRAQPSFLQTEEDSDVEMEDNTVATENEYLKVLETVLETAAGTAECRAALQGSVNPLPQGVSQLAQCSKQYDRLVGAGAQGFAAYSAALSLPLRPTVHTAVIHRLTAKLKEQRSKPNKTLFPDAATQSMSLLQHLVAKATKAHDVHLKLSAAEGLQQMQRMGYHYELETWSDVVQVMQPPAQFKPNWGYEELLIQAKLDVLRVLVDTICGADSRAMLAAAETLKVCLATQDNSKLLQAADKNLRDDLVPFFPLNAPSKVIRPSHIPTPCLDTVKSEVLKATSTATDEATWTEPNFAKWSRIVSSGLLSGCRDPFFERCCAAALIIPEIASTVLPVAVVDLALGGRDDSLQKRVARLMSKKLESCDPETAKHLLCGITTVNALLTEDIKRHGIRLKGGKSLGFSVPPGGIPPFMAKLHIPSAVSAAIGCGSRATALRLAESCLERGEHGGLVCLNKHFFFDDAHGTDASTHDQLDDILASAHNKRNTTRRSLSTQGEIRCRPSAGYHDKQRLLADDIHFKKLLVQVATSARDHDLLTGFVDGSDPRFRRQLFESAGDWGKALVCSDAEAQAGKGAEDLPHILRSYGLYGVLSRMDKAKGSAAMLAQWGNESEEGSFPTLLHESLGALENQNASTFFASIRQMTEQVVGELSDQHRLETCLSKLNCVQLLNEAYNLKGAVPKDEELRRCGLIDMHQHSTATSFASDLLMPHLLATKLLGTLGRSELCCIAIRAAVQQLSTSGNTSSALSLIYRTRLEYSAIPADLCVVEAELLRKRGDNTAAVASLERVGTDLSAIHTSVLKQGKNVSQVAPLLAHVLCTLGIWIGEDTREGRSNVISGYLMPAAKLVANVDCAEKGKIFFDLARFLDKLYTTLSSRESASSGRQMEEVDRKYGEAYEFLQTNKGKIGKTKEMVLKHTSRILGAISNRAEEEEERLIADQSAYLVQSVKSYCVASMNSDENDLVSVFRIVALWLKNADNEELNHYLTGFFGKVAKTAKFIPLAYQLVSRLSLSPDAAQSQFQSTLTVLVERLAREHPHHTLYHLSALRFGAYLPENNRLKDAFVADPRKIAAAKRILQNLAKNKVLSPVIREMDAVVEAYLQFAFLPMEKADQRSGKAVLVPSTLKIAKVGSFKNSVVTSIDLPVSGSGDYSHAPTIHSFENQYTTAGGINLPKIIKCMGSDGVSYKQLVKGAMDDLRQDAVIEQFFSLCNSLFLSDLTTNKADTSVRTYKVVPISPTAGVVQWVEQTLPMGEWLISRSAPQNGGHVRYRPQDLTYTEAREHLSVKGLSDAEKRKAFQNICDGFAPVFHYFFAEMYPQPQQWVEARATYTRSTAVSSMVGYIIGLGDRHSQNILIDVGTGEVVHIDLGVAFERGKNLPVPEIVPFRLTRDIIDGFGVSGVEGTFRSTCERSLSVLRRNKQLLETIIEVFIYDPLCDYSLDIDKVMSRQCDRVEDKGSASKQKKTHKDDDREEGTVKNADAELTLRRVAEKVWVGVVGRRGGSSHAFLSCACA